MFVSNVDCGWLNTPFHLEGVLVKDADEIDLFAKLTEYVTVSPSRSDESVLKAYLTEKFGAERYNVGYEDINNLSDVTRLGPVTVAAPADDDFISQGEAVEIPDEPEAKGMLASLLARFKPSFGARRAEAAEGGGEEPSAKRPPYMPPELRLTTYSEPDFNWAALPVSVAVTQSTLAAIDNFMATLATQRIGDVDKLKRAANMMAEHIAVYPSAMMWAAKIHKSNNKLYQRSLEASIYMTALGRHLGFPQDLLADMALIGMLLDLGKIRLNGELLDKPGQYTEGDLQAVRGHVELGLGMIQGGAVSPVVLRAVSEHHERVDGGGYPGGLGQDQISVYGKMAAIADAYTAMINPRPYAKTMAPHQAIKQLFAGAGTQWFAPLVEQFVQAIGAFPVGALIELNTGHVAIVVQHNPLRRLEPKILIVTHGNKKRRTPPLQLDMLKHNARRVGKTKRMLRILKGLPEGAYGIDVRDYYSVPQ